MTVKGFIALIHLTQASTILPVSRCGDGYPCVRYDNSTQGAYLTLGPFSYGQAGIRRYSLSSGYIDLWSERSEDESTETFAMGPASEIVHRVGSVGYIRGPDRLLLGLSSADFNRTCQPGTRVDLPLENRSGGIGLEGEEPAMREMTLERHRHEFPPHIAAMIRLHFIRYGASLVRMPPSSFHAAMAEIESWDFPSSSNRWSLMPQDPETVVLGDCNADMVQSAPVLYVSLRHAQFILYPNDYIHHDSERDICTFLFTCGISSWAPWSIAPLTIPDTNVFVTQSSISICESV